MKPQSATPAADRPDLGRLNENERRALRLLAEGHTAKSIAAATGCSTAAVNERLREARRKTGTGSSRELARQLRAQEIRNDKIDLAPAAAPSEERAALRPELRTHFGEVAIMTLLLTGAAAAIVLTMAGVPAGAPAVPSVASPDPVAMEDPLLDGALPPPPTSNPTPERLHAALRSEQRDPAWATATEAALRARYGEAARLSGPGGGPRVTCGSTICEIAGYVDPPARAKGDRTLGQDPVAVDGMRAGMLPGRLYDDVARLGLTSGAGLFTVSRRQPGKRLFFTYWLRAER